jgi:hypothetical protein
MTPAGLDLAIAKTGQARPDRGRGPHAPLGTEYVQGSGATGPLTPKLRLHDLSENGKFRQEQLIPLRRHYLKASVRQTRELILDYGGTPTLHIDVQL